MTTMIDGKKIQAKIFAQIAPLLEGKKVSFVQFGNDPVSTKFVRIKSAAAEALGMVVHKVHIIDHLTTEEAVAIVKKEAVGANGIVVQLPLSDGLDQQIILQAVPPALDIDVLNPETITQFRNGATTKLPPVAGAIDTILKECAINLAGKKVVLLGKGRLVGEPVSGLFDRNTISYSIFDKESDENEMHASIKEADVLISGIGVPGFVTADMIKDGVILIDAGTSEQNGKLKGDIDAGCYEKASYYTPVPGGVGPVAVATLFENLIKN